MNPSPSRVPRPKTQGDNNVQAKLSNDEVLQIKKRLKAGEPTRILAEEYDVSRSLVCHIKSGRRWAHVVLEGEAGPAVTRPHLRDLRVAAEALAERDIVLETDDLRAALEAVFRGPA